MEMKWTKQTANKLQFVKVLEYLSKYKSFDETIQQGIKI